MSRRRVFANSVRSKRKESAPETEQSENRSFCKKIGELTVERDFYHEGSVD